MLYGIGNKEGVVAECRYNDAVMYYGHDIIALKNEKGWHYYDKEGKLLIENACEPIESHYSCDLGWEEGSGKICPYLDNEGFIPVKINGESGYYDTQGNEVIPVGTFAETRPVHNGKAWVKDKKSGLWGVIILGNMYTDNSES